MPKLSKPKIDIKTDKTLKFFIAFATAIVITAMFPRTETIEADYTVGMIWGKEDLIAPFSFPIYKSEPVYQREVQEVRNRISPAFDINEPKQLGKLNWLDSLSSFLTRAKKVLDYQNEINKEKNLPEEKRTTSEQSLNGIKAELNHAFSDSDWNALYNIVYSTSSGNLFDNFRKKLIQTMTQANNKQIINIPKNTIQSGKISFIKNKVEETIDISQVRDTLEVMQMLRNDYESYFRNDELAKIALKISGKFIYSDFTYNKEETDKIIASVTDAVPRTFGIVRENERIVSKHDPINEATKLKLDSYYKIRNEQMGGRDFWVQQGGRFLFVSLMMFLLGIFLFKMRSSVYEDNTKLILLSTIILLQCLFSYISINLEINYPIEYLIFVPVAAMLLTIVFDSRLAVYTIIIICILVSAIRGGDYDIFVPNFAASILVVYSVRDIKHRTQIFISMIYIIGGYIIAILAIGLERYESFSIIKTQLYFAALNSVLSPILAYGLLLFYEKVFRVATDLVFLELSDFNHPLLRELASKAPGSFHHSVVMGNLSEQAAKEIGANQILARVGCYYHDIGKIISPNYFVENQLDSRNKHEQLNPSLSAKMIIAHVKNGIKLAEKYRIPQEVINFIPMHHGTTLVSYFYEKARSEEDPDDTVHDYIYRYPGPKPHTKETGIVMLADSVEAATRAIEDPTPAKLETQIDEIIKSRFLDGELDECDLTLQDLIKIKYSFLKTVVGIHHHRIRYPEQVNEE
ncbi:MAG: HDIG domain-containing protein [Ignavibacteriae bacterium]|nr:MAG: HDIG domain-containing protein [Ignavibacteriota bacterium]